MKKSKLYRKYLILSFAVILPASITLASCQTNKVKSIVDGVIDFRNSSYSATRLVSVINGINDPAIKKIARILFEDAEKVSTDIVNSTKKQDGLNVKDGVSNKLKVPSFESRISRISLSHAEMQRWNTRGKIHNTVEVNEISKLKVWLKSYFESRFDNKRISRSSQGYLEYKKMFYNFIDCHETTGEFRNVVSYFGRVIKDEKYREMAIGFISIIDSIQNPSYLYTSEGLRIDSRMNVLSLVAQVPNIQERFEVMLEGSAPAIKQDNLQQNPIQSARSSLLANDTSSLLNDVGAPKPIPISPDLIAKFAFRILNGRIDLNELLSLVYPDIIALFGPELALITQDLISAFAPSAIPSGKYTLDFITNSAVNQILDLAGFVLNAKISDLFDLKSTLSNLIKPIFEQVNEIVDLEYLSELLKTESPKSFISPYNVLDNFVKHTFERINFQFDSLIDFFDGVLSIKASTILKFIPGIDSPSQENVKNIIEAIFGNFEYFNESDNKQKSYNETFRESVVDSIEQSYEKLKEIRLLNPSNILKQQNFAKDQEIIPVILEFFKTKDIYDTSFINWLVVEKYDHSFNSINRNSDIGSPKLSVSQQAYKLSEFFERYSDMPMVNRMKYWITNVIRRSSKVALYNKEINREKSEFLNDEVLNTIIGKHHSAINSSLKYVLSNIILNEGDNKTKNIITFEAANFLVDSLESINWIYSDPSLKFQTPDKLLEASFDLILKFAVESISSTVSPDIFGVITDVLRGNYKENGKTIDVWSDMTNRIFNLSPTLIPIIREEIRKGIVASVGTFLTDLLALDTDITSMILDAINTAVNRLRGPKRGEAYNWEAIKILPEILRNIYNEALNGSIFNPRLIRANLLGILDSVVRNAVVSEVKNTINNPQYSPFVNQFNNLVDFFNDGLANNITRTFNRTKDEKLNVLSKQLEVRSKVFANRNISQLRPLEIIEEYAFVRFNQSLDVKVTEKISTKPIAPDYIINSLIKALDSKNRELKKK
jgi:hypothetical protein